MEDLADAWVPGKAGKPAAREPVAAVALRRLADAMEAAAAGNQSASDLLLADARWLLGDSAARTIYAMQVSGRAPDARHSAWDELMATAAAGDVEIVTRVGSGNTASQRRRRRASQPRPPSRRSSPTRCGPWG